MAIAVASIFASTGIACNCASQTQPVRAPVVSEQLPPKNTEIGEAMTPVTTKEAREKVRIELSQSNKGEDGRPRVVITVRNVGDIPFKWDRECIALMAWNAICDGGQHLAAVRHQGADVERNELANRFIVIDPDTSITKEVDLFGEARFFHHARMASSVQGVSIVVPTGFEEIAHVHITPNCKKLSVEVTYEGGNADAADSFSIFYGLRPEAVGVPVASVTSNTVVIELDMPSNGR